MTFGEALAVFKTSVQASPFIKPRAKTLRALGIHLAKAVIGLKRYLTIVVAIPSEPVMVHLSVRWLVSLKAW